MVASRPDDDIVVVDQHHALGYNCIDGACDMALQPDNRQYVHPNQAGYDKIAKLWVSSLLNSDKLARCE
jgi:hypothetical protein